MPPRPVDTTAAHEYVDPLGPMNLRRQAATAFKLIPRFLQKVSIVMKQSARLFISVLAAAFTVASVAPAMAQEKGKDAKAAPTAAAPAAAPKPGPELKKLDMFVGKWKQEGQAQVSPYGPAGKLTSVDSYEWMPGGFFMTHHWDAVQAGVAIKGMEVIGYDAAKKVYTTRFFDNYGNSGWQTATVQGNTWTWTGDSEVGGKPIKEKCTVTVVSQDLVTAKCEYSTDGAKWLPNFDLKSTRAK